MPEPILKVEDLTRLFRVGGFRSRGQLHAIDEVRVSCPVDASALTLACDWTPEIATRLSRLMPNVVCAWARTL